MILGHLVGPESKEVLKKIKKLKKGHGRMSKGNRSQFEGIPLAKSGVV